MGLGCILNNAVVAKGICTHRCASADSTPEGAHLDEIVNCSHHHDRVAYPRILDRLPGDDEAFKAVAYFYGALKQDELLREWLLQRAGNVSFTYDKRADAFVALASKDWDCSFKITEQPNSKVTTVAGNKTSFRYQMPKERLEFEQARECANRGLEMANAAITLMPKTNRPGPIKQI